MELVIAAVAFALGVGLSAFAVAFQRFRTHRRVESSEGAAALFLPDLAPMRSVPDILAGRINITLGGQRYVLPVLPRGQSREWLAAVDLAAAETLDAIADAGDDGQVILGLVESYTDKHLDSVVSYDRTGVLPPRQEIDRTATGVEIIRAAVEVWRAANPLAVTVASGSQPSGISSGRLSSALTATAGDQPSSSATSLTSSSSPTSTLPSTVSPGTASTTSPNWSRESEPEPSSPTPRASGPTSGGQAGPRLESVP